MAWQSHGAVTNRPTSRRVEQRRMKGSKMRNLLIKCRVEPVESNWVGNVGMLMPDDAVYLQVLEERGRALRARKEDAERRHARAQARRLQAEIDELDADLDSIIRAAVLV